jgi:hypothetical protein
MDKRLLGLVWNLPASFSLPSVAACRGALARIQLPGPAAPARGIAHPRHRTDGHS